MYITHKPLILLYYYYYYIYILIICFVINNNLVEDDDVMENSSPSIEKCDDKQIKMNDFNLEETVELTGWFIIMVCRNLKLNHCLLYFW